MTNQEWIESHLEEIRQHSGKWLAIDSCSIVAIGKEMEDVMVEANNKGYSNPVVFKIPDSSSRSKISSPKKTESQVWVVGKITTYPAWEIKAIMTSEKDAATLCKDLMWFIGPMNLNTPLSDKTTTWPGLYFPNLPE